MEFVSVFVKKFAAYDHTLPSSFRTRLRVGFAALLSYTRGMFPPAADFVCFFLAASRSRARESTAAQVSLLGGLLD
jgi:hypothetical protein